MIKKYTYSQLCAQLTAGNEETQNRILIAQKAHREYRFPSPTLLHEEECREEKRTDGEEADDDGMAPRELRTANLDGQHQRENTHAEERGAGEVDTAELLAETITTAGNVR